MALYIKIQVLSSRFVLIEENTNENSEVTLLDIENPGDLLASVTENKLTVSSALTGEEYISRFPAESKVKIRPFGSETWSVVDISSMEQDIQEVLNRDRFPVISSGEYNLDDFVKPDLTTAKSEDTQFVHNDGISNGGAVILENESAKLGVQGNHIEFDSTGSYGDVNINVKTSNSNSDNAIHIYGTNLYQLPQIEMKGDTEFEGNVILTSPNGTKYYLRVDNSGNLGTSAV